MNVTLPLMDLQTRILIVDDDEGIRSLISSFLDRHGYFTETAPDAAGMRTMLANDNYDLIVLDVMMPQEDGLTALRSLQQSGAAPPVIMLSAVGTDIDRIVGLEMGADDYLAKPCNPRELLARIRTVLRRRAVEAPTLTLVEVKDEEGVFRFAGWKMDALAHLLYNPVGDLVTLSSGEFRLLRAFVEHPRRVLTRDQLLDYARGEDSEFYDRAIDVQLSRLRQKLGSGSTDMIRTIRNEGYMFTPTVER